MAYTLTLLGTDTVYTPKPNPPYYEEGETLSIVSSLLTGTPQIGPRQSNDAIELKNSAMTLIKGPSTAGGEVGARIADGVCEILEAIQKGETKINIIAHSRGAVEAILIAHELKRIQTLLLDKNCTPEQITGSPCKLTKTALLQKQPLIQIDDVLRNNLQETEISILNIDPVPGGRYYGTPGIRWEDPRFYKLPDIVKEYEEYVYENERSRCFKAIVPDHDPTKTVFKLQALPGHHGTGSGNLRDQQGQAVQDGNTSHVQQLLLLKLIDFLHRHDAHFKTTDEINQLQVTGQYSANLITLIKTVLTAENTNGSIKNHYLQLYNDIIKNRTAYQHFNKTHYKFLGQEQAWWAMLGMARDERILHHKEHNDTYLSTILAGSGSTHFLNAEHAQLYFTNILHVKDSTTPGERIRHITDTLLNTMRHAATLKRSESDESMNVTLSTREDPFASIAATKVGEAMLSECLNIVIEEIGQTYLNSQMSATHHRQFSEAVKDAITQFKAASEQPDQADLSNALFAQLQTGIKETLTKKCDLLIQTANELIIQSSAAYHMENLIHELSDSIAQLDLSHLTQANLTECNSLKQVLSQAKLDLQNTHLIAAIPTAIDRNVKQIKQATERLPEENQLKQFSNFIQEITQSASENIAALPTASDRLKDTIEMCIHLNDRIINIEDFVKDAPIAGFNANAIILNLTARKALLIHHAASLVFTNNLSLEQVKALCNDPTQTIQHTDLAKSIIAQAINLGVSDPDMLTLRAEHARQMESANKELLAKQTKIDGLEKENAVFKTEKNQSQRSVDEQNDKLKENSQTIEELRTTIAQKENEVTQATATITALNATLQNYTSLNEKCQTLIDDQLLSLTKNYLMHLILEINRHTTPKLTLDSNGSINGLEHIPNPTPTILRLRGKIHKVSELYCLLINQEQPAYSRIEKFDRKFTEYRIAIMAHRDGAGERYCKNIGIALSILLTGILPGLAVLAIRSAKTGQSMRFWRSQGENYAEKAQVTHHTNKR